MAGDTTHTEKGVRSPSHRSYNPALPPSSPHNVIANCLPRVHVSERRGTTPMVPWLSLSVPAANSAVGCLAGKRPVGLHAPHIDVADGGETASGAAGAEY